MVKIDEKTLEDMLFDSLETYSGIERLNKRGLDFQFHPHTLLFRQFNTKDYGIMDILRVEFYRGLVFVEVIELKVVPFELNHLTQLGRYLSFVRRLIKDNKLESKTYVKGTLIVSSFDSSNDYTWIDSIIGTNIRVFSTEYNLDGVKFEKQMPNGWYKTGTNSHIPDYIDQRVIRAMHKNSCNDKELPF